MADGYRSPAKRKKLGAINGQVKAGAMMVRNHVGAG